MRPLFFSTLLILLAVLPHQSEAKSRVELTGPELQELLSKSYYETLGTASFQAEIGRVKQFYKNKTILVQYVGKLESGSRVYFAGLRRDEESKYAALDFPQYFFQVSSFEGEAPRAQEWYPELPTVKYAMVTIVPIVDGALDFTGSFVEDPANQFLVEFDPDHHSVTQALMGVLAVKGTLEFPPLMIKPFRKIKNSGSNLPWHSWQPDQIETGLLTDEVLKTNKSVQVVTALYDPEMKLISGGTDLDYQKTAASLERGEWNTSDGVVSRFYQRQLQGGENADFASPKESFSADLKFPRSTENLKITSIENYGTNGHQYKLHVIFENGHQLVLQLPNAYRPEKSPRIAIQDLRSSFQDPTSPLASWGYHEPWTQLDYVENTQLGGIPKHTKMKDAQLEFVEVDQDHFELKVHANLWMRKESQKLTASFEGNKNTVKVELNAKALIPKRMVNPCETALKFSAVSNPHK